MLTAIIILTIVLTSVVNLLNYNNRVSATNTEQLVAINLAKSSIEQLKVQEKEVINMIPNKNNLTEWELNKKTCTNPRICHNLFEVVINDTDYVIKVFLSQIPEEKKLNLIDIRVEVTVEDRLAFAEVEGYLND